MISRAVSSGTIDSLGLVLSTSMVLPKGVVNFCGTIPQAYFISVRTDLSLSSLDWAIAGAWAPASNAAAHANATPALVPLRIFAKPLTLQPVRYFPFGCCRQP